MIRFRNATLAELGDILDWAAAEGWNPGLDDTAAFYAADPDGFFVAQADEVVVAAISVVNHNDTFAFLGLYIVRPAFRGQGIGHGLWQHAIAHAGTRTIGLDGVPDQQANYAASGFARAGGTTRFEGPIAPEVDPAIRAARDDDIPSLIAQEAKASGASKPAYLTAWFSNTPNRQTFLGPDGFVTVRKCREGAKIGPLLGDTPETVLRLIRHAASVFDGPLVIDVPDGAVEVASLCAELGMEAGFQTARMYRGPAPRGSGDLYTVASLELG